MSERLSRPQTAGLVELHVFYVPEELWNSKLHTVSTEMISKFISAGFIRASPDMRLLELRERLGEFLWEDGLADTFLFLKCVGRSLAVVKRKQEKELKLKSFAPPYALQPELYLLPGVDYKDSIPALSPDTQLYSVFTPDPPRYISSGPEIQIYSAVSSDTQNYVTSGPEKPQVNDLLPDKQPQSVNFTQTHTSPQSPRSFNNVMRTHVHIPLIDVNKKRTPVRTDMKDGQAVNWIVGEQDSISVLTQKNTHREDNTQKPESNALLSPRKEDLVALVGHIPENRSEMEDIRKHLERNTARDSGIPESLTDREIEYAQTKRRQEKGKREAFLSDRSQKQLDQDGSTERSILPQPAQYSSPPPPPLLILSSTIIQPQPTLPAPTTADNQVPTFQTTEREELIEKLKQMKEERKHLEKNREELVKRAKGLLEQNKLRRNHARDVWKKKYYETKKITAFLEEKVNRLREELELYYQKLLTHLAARDTRERARHPRLALNSKNNMIIQVTTKQQEIDQLRRKLDNTKMKLVVEIKMRRQAASDLRALRAELAQKKIQSSLSSQPSTFVT